MRRRRRWLPPHISAPPVFTLQQQFTQTEKNKTGPAKWPQLASCLTDECAEAGGGFPPTSPRPPPCFHSPAVHTENLLLAGGVQRAHGTGGAPQGDGSRGQAPDDHPLASPTSPRPCFHPPSSSSHRQRRTSSASLEPDEIPSQTGEAKAREGPSFGESAFRRRLRGAWGGFSGVGGLQPRSPVPASGVARRIALSRLPPSARPGERRQKREVGSGWRGSGRARGRVHSFISGGGRRAW